MEFIVEFYVRAGGSINLSNDTLIDDGELKVASSAESEGTPGAVAAGYVVRVGFNVTSTAGDEIQLYAWVEKDGQPITLDPADECVFDLYEFDSDLSAFESPLDPVNPSDNGQFENLVGSLALNDDVEYLVKATVTIGGVDLNGQDSFPMIGAA